MKDICFNLNNKYSIILKEVIDVFSKYNIEVVVIKTVARFLKGLKPEDVDILILNTSFDCFYKLELALWLLSRKGYFIKSFGSAEIRLIKDKYETPRVDIYKYIKYLGIDFSYVKKYIRSSKKLVTLCNTIFIPKPSNIHEILLEALHSILGHNLFRYDDKIACDLYIRELAANKHALDNIKLLENGELLFRLIYEYIKLCVKAYKERARIYRPIPTYSKALIGSNVPLLSKIKHLLNYILLAFPLSFYFRLKQSSVSKSKLHRSRMARVLQVVLFMYNTIIRSTHA